MKPVKEEVEAVAYDMDADADFLFGNDAVWDGFLPVRLRMPYSDLTVSAKENMKRGV